MTGPADCHPQRSRGQRASLPGSSCSPALPGSIFPSSGPFLLTKGSVTQVAVTAHSSASAFCLCAVLFGSKGWNLRPHACEANAGPAFCLERELLWKTSECPKDAWRSTRVSLAALAQLSDGINCETSPFPPAPICLNSSVSECDCVWIQSLQKRADAGSKASPPAAAQK